MAKSGKSMNITHTLTLAGGGVLGGVLAGTMVSSKIPYIKDNTKLSFITPVAIGVGLKMFAKKSPMLSTLADGLIVGGAVIGAGHMVPALGIGGFSSDDINDAVADAVAASADQATAHVDALLGGGVNALPGLEHSLGEDINEEMNDEMNEEMNDYADQY